VPNFVEQMFLNRDDDPQLFPWKWTTVCALSDLEEDKGKYVEIGGVSLAVFRHGGKVHVMDNACPHAGANLAGGSIYEGCVICPKHNWPFRLSDGQLRDTPGVRVEVYAVRVSEGMNRVEIILPSTE
jgi:nitrite reductase/ring-hydroxylating ferredoxin subunit